LLFRCVASLLRSPRAFLGGMSRGRFLPLVHPSPLDSSASAGTVAPSLGFDSRSMQITLFEVLWRLGSIVVDGSWCGELMTEVGSFAGAQPTFCSLDWQEQSAEY
jgi:hypothetical protein